MPMYLYDRFGSVQISKARGKRERWKAGFDVTEGTEVNCFKKNFAPFVDIWLVLSFSSYAVNHDSEKTFPSLNNNIPMVEEVENLDEAMEAFMEEKINEEDEELFSQHLSGFQERVQPYSQETISQDPLNFSNSKSGMVMDCPSQGVQPSSNSSEPDAEVFDFVDTPTGDQPLWTKEDKKRQQTPGK